MQYKQLNHKAKQIDNHIDAKLEQQKEGTFLTQRDVENVVLAVCPDFYFLNAGWHKVVFGIHSIGGNVVFKVGPKRSIHSDHIAYKRVPKSLRHQVFAKMYWHTKYCLLQQYGSVAAVSATETDRLRRLLWQYGVFDIKPENIRMVDGQLKLVDANITSFPFPGVIERLGMLGHKMPKKIVSITRRILNR